MSAKMTVGLFGENLNMKPSHALIVYCHPWEGSFNNAILRSVIRSLDADGIAYDLIDLHKDGFNPVYDAEELSLYHAGGTKDPLVTRYLGLLKACDVLVFVTPVWWNEIPGMLKGFFDKVMKEGEGLSHVITKTGIRGTLTNIRKAYVFSTSTSPTWYLRLFMGNYMKRIFIRKTLKQIGVRRGTWINLGSMPSTAARRTAFLDKCARMHFTV